MAGLAVVAACGAQGGGGGAPAAVVATAPVQVGPPGAAIYQRSCSRCHGVNRQGDGTAPALDATRMASIGDQPMQMLIAYGKGQMPAFGGLSTEQVNELIAYLRGL